MTAPTVYNFHPITREFVGNSLADPSPLEPGKWLDPANSTRQPPPIAPADHVPVMKSVGWVIVEDHRGEVWYDGETPVTIDFLGDPSKKNYTTTAPDKDPDPVDEVTEDDIRREGQRRLESIIHPYLEGERETWFAQVHEAKSVLADSEYPTPLLSVLAAARNITVADMAAVVLQKHQSYSIAVATVLANQQTILMMDPYPSDFKTNEDYWPG